MLGRRTQGSSPEELYRGLRDRALHAVEKGLAAPPPSHPNVSGVLIDIPAQGRIATLVALTDGTTSLYTSVGGGTIGIGEHESVAGVTQALLGVVEAHLDLFVGGDDGTLPPAGYVRFHVLSSTGPRFRDVPEASFWGKSPHELAPVIGAAHDVMTAARQVSPEQA